jgi:excisionase family DNA binding protein
MLSSPPDIPIAPVGDVANCLKVTERAGYRLVTAKQITAFKVGGIWRLSRADIDRWIQQQSEDAMRGGGQ